MKKIKRKKAASSIVLIMILLTALMFITGFLDITSHTYIMKNLQTTIDQTAVASISAPGVINHEMLKEELFVVDTSELERYFRASVDGLVDDSENSPIKDFSVESVIVTVVDKSDTNRANWGFDDDTQRSFVIVEVVAKASIKSSPMFDAVSGFRKKFYNSFSNKNFTVTYGGSQKQDGRSEIIIRTMSKGTIK